MAMSVGPDLWSSSLIPLPHWNTRPSATAIFLLSSCNELGVAIMDMPMPAAPSSNHGFYLLGERTFLLSHIPMFMDPHQAQLFLEVGLSISGGADPVKIYHEDQKKNPGSVYVLVTDP